MFFLELIVAIQLQRMTMSTWKDCMKVLSQVTLEEVLMKYHIKIVQLTMPQSS